MSGENAEAQRIIEDRIIELEKDIKTVEEFLDILTETRQKMRDYIKQEFANPGISERMIMA